MERGEFISALKELTEKEDVLGVSREVKELQTRFEDYTLDEERKFQISQMEAEEKGEEFEAENWIAPLKAEFYEVYGEYQDRRKALKETKRKEEEDNLLRKRHLITQLREVIDTEENIGAAFASYKQINERWRTIGNVPREKRNDIQQDYSRLSEEFFYNMRIYKEIKDYDLEKNFDTKKQLIERLKVLEQNENIREIESNIKALQDEWEDIGPTKQELWEEIKNEYWETINAIYNKINAFYEGRRQEHQENLEKKQGLVEKVGAIFSGERQTAKDWNTATDEILAVQEEWKTIGFGPRKENEEVWAEFRKICNQFFDAKSEFYKGIQSEYDKIVDKKKALIDKVEELRDSTDWGETTKTIINLQKEWKELGSAGQRNEQKLWKRFRGACDSFFNSKEAHFAEKSKVFEANLKEKEHLIEQIKAYELPEDKKEAINQLKEFSDKFANIGHVPRAHKDEVYKAYKDAINTHYDALDLKGVQKEKVLFEARMNTIKGSGDSSEIFRKERQAIRREIDMVQQQILQFENNLGFFANSKGTNPLKEQAEKNIKREQEKLQALKAKLKLIPNE